LDEAARLIRLHELWQQEQRDTVKEQDGGAVMAWGGGGEWDEAALGGQQVGILDISVFTIIVLFALLV
jgi:hypothetical protein